MSTGEKIKIECGSALDDLENPPNEMEIQGRDLLTGKPKSVLMTHKDVALDKSIIRIEDTVETFSNSSRTRIGHLQFRNILSRWRSLLRGLDTRLSNKTDLPVYISEDPLRAVVRGTGIALKNLEIFKNILVRYTLNLWYAANHFILI